VLEDRPAQMPDDGASLALVLRYTEGKINGACAIQPSPRSR